MTADEKRDPRERLWVAFGLASVGLVGAIVAVYLVIMSQEGDTPVWWFMGGLVVALILLLYALWPAAPHRRQSVVAAAIVLFPLGVLGAASIGLPLLLAAGLAVASLGRDLLPETDDG
jgi:hypothetical protein